MNSNKKQNKKKQIKEMMGEKKQNINLYKQLANRQDQANRQLEQELNDLKQQSMHINAMNPEDLEALRREEEELIHLENQLQNTKQNEFNEYKNMQWEQPGFQNQNILGKQQGMIPQTNPGYEDYQNDNYGYDDGSSLPMESRVINQSQNEGNVFSRPENGSFRNQPVHVNVSFLVFLYGFNMNFFEFEGFFFFI